MWTTIECAGNPRDMGMSQGAAARTAIRAEIARAGLAGKRSRTPTLAALAVGPVRGQGAGREFFRHFAHQAERLEGLAYAADVPVDSVLDLHLRVRAGGALGGLLSRRTTLRTRSINGSGSRTGSEQGTAKATENGVPGAGNGEGKRALLERSLPHRLDEEAGWIVRESRPEVGFRSIEIGLPWLVSAVAGVNEGGLAVVAGPLLWGTPGRAGWPPPLLLVQECLQRFEDLEGALDWCQKRPVEGEQSFVLADASGAVATVIANGRTRRITQGDGELYLEGGEPPEPDGEGADRVWLDPKARRLQLDASGVAIEIGL